MFAVHPIWFRDTIIKMSSVSPGYTWTNIYTSLYVDDFQYKENEVMNNSSNWNSELHIVLIFSWKYSRLTSDTSPTPAGYRNCSETGNIELISND